MNTNDIVHLLFYSGNRLFFLNNIKELLKKRQEVTLTISFTSITDHRNPLYLYAIVVLAIAAISITALVITKKR